MHFTKKVVVAVNMTDLLLQQLSILKTMDFLKQKNMPKVLPANFEGKMRTHCLFLDNPKKKICEYLQEGKFI